MSKYDYRLPFQFKLSEFMDPSSQFSILTYQVDKPYQIHWHEFCEMEYVISGTGSQILNGVTHPLEKGSLYFINPSDFHEIIVEKENPVELYNVKLSETLIRDELYHKLYSNEKENITVLSGQNFIDVENDFKLLLNEYNNARMFKEILITDLIEKILITIIRNGSSNNTSNSIIEPKYLQHHVYKSLIYIQNNFQKNITLEEMANLSHISPNYFSELFHKTVGCSFQNYLQNLKLRNALILLKNTKLTASEICERSGFNSYAHFSRLFKQKYGYSPRSLHKKITMGNL